MNVRAMEKCFLALASLALTLGLLSQPMLGQAPGDKPEEKPAAKTRAKPRGRVPALYGKIIDPSQREAIYKINDSYAPKIGALQAELRDLIAKRDAEVENVLTAEQKEKLNALKAEAKAKRDAASKKEASKPAGEEKAASGTAPAKKAS